MLKVQHFSIGERNWPLIVTALTMDRELAVEGDPWKYDMPMHERAAAVVDAVLWATKVVERGYRELRDPRVMVRLSLSVAKADVAFDSQEMDIIKDMFRQLGIRNDTIAPHADRVFYRIYESPASPSLG